MLKLFAALLCVSFAADLPFWKAKEKWVERVQNGEVVVSVTSHNKEGSPKHVMVLSGGGHVHVPCAYVFKEVQNYEEMAKTSGYIRDAKYDPGTHTLTFTVAAFFYASTMKAKLEIKSDAQPVWLESTLLNGPMQGLVYRLTFSALTAKKCEVALSGEYGYDVFPIHRLFLEWGMEAVFQGVAKRLRSHVEESYTSRTKNSSL